MYKEELMTKEQQKDNLDEFVYYVSCIATLGIAYLLRLVIITAIKKAK